MKKIFSVNEATTPISLGLLMARISIAALMLTHGIPKLTALLSDAPIKFAPVMGLSAEISLALAVFAEVFCSLFFLFGFATRLAAIPLIITMSVAALFVHAADPIGIKEPALLYLSVYIVLFFTGSGKYSFDYLVQQKSSGLPTTKASSNVFSIQ